MIFRSKHTFPSGLHRVPVEIFGTRCNGLRPSVLFLHGAAGLTPRYYPLVRCLAENGYLTFAPLYLRAATVKSNREVPGSNFLHWLGIIWDALLFMASQPDVHPSFMGIVGISLGAALGISVAAKDSRIRAFAGLSGDVPAYVIANPLLIPPTLIVHGKLDRVMPVSRVVKLACVLESQDIPCYLKIYHGEGHLFGAAAALDAAGITIRFLDRHLKLYPRIDMSTALGANGRQFTI